MFMKPEKEKTVKRNEDIIPYIYNIPNGFQQKISLYSPTNRNQKMQDNCLGSGVSRETYVYPEREDLVIKITKSYKKGTFTTRLGGQSKNEISAFLNFSYIRKWMPQIYNYDEKSFLWMISERCDTDKEKLKEIIKNGDKERKNIIFNYFDFKDSSHEESFLKLFHPLRKRIDLTASIIKKNPDFKEFLYLDNLNIENHEIVYRKLGSNMKIKDFILNSKNKKFPKNNLYLEWATLLTPLVSDFANESVESKVVFRDLHENNLGISLKASGENSIRIIDMGVFNS